jgi:hypothetical protein
MSISRKLLIWRTYPGFRDRAPRNHKSRMSTLIGLLIPLMTVVVSAAVSYCISAMTARHESEDICNRQRSLVLLSVEDLLSSLRAESGFPLSYAREDYIYGQPQRPKETSFQDDYYKKYRLVDITYRLCAVIGWMELYREDASFLNDGEISRRSHLEKIFASIRDDLANEFTQEKGGLPWMDAWILEDEQRAIGEKMLTKVGAAANSANQQYVSVKGYASFCEDLFKIPRPEDPTIPTNPFSQNYWVWNATRFFVDRQVEGLPDFRTLRVARLMGDLQSLKQILLQDSGSYTM